VHEFLTLDEIAAELNTTPDQAYRLVRCGEIRGTWLPDAGEWRIERRELDAYCRAASRG
jgi:excisionase family DNA binding protein